MDPRLIDTIRYDLFSGRPSSDFTDYPLYNRVYRFWEKFWNRVYLDNGTDHTVRRDDFWRQDCLSVLSQGDTVLGLMASTVFDLRCEAAHEHSYFINSC